MTDHLDSQPTTEPAPTDAAPEDLAGHDPTRGPRLKARLVATVPAVVAWLERPRRGAPEIWDDPQPSLKEILTHSLEGDWTAAEGGARRVFHLTDTILLALPIVALAYGIAWLARRPLRRAVGTPIVLSCTTLLAHVHILGWLIPAFLDITTWF